MKLPRIACIALLSCFVGSEALARNLGDLVPIDACAYARWNGGKDGAFTAGYLSQLRAALSGAGIVDEFTRLMKEGLEDGEDKKGFDLEAAHWKSVLSEVPWWDLVKSDAVLAMRVGVTGSFELICGFRVGSETERDRALGRLRQVLRGLCGVVDEYEMLESDREGVPTTVLYNLVDPGDQVCLGGVGNVVVMSTSALLLRESLELYQGRSSRLSFPDSENYEKLVADVPVKSDEPAMAEFELLYYPRAIFTEISRLDVLDSCFLRAQIGKTRVDWSLRYQVRSDESLLARSFEDQTAVDDLVKWVPKNATAFTVESGARSDLFYDFGLELLEFLSGGPTLPELLREQQSSAKIDLRDDLLRHLTGRQVSFRLPGADGKSSGAWVSEIVRDPTDRAAAREQMTKLGEWIRKLAVPVNPVELDGIEGELFVADSAGLLGWYLYFGVSGYRFAVSTSEEAFRKALSSDEASILANERFGSLWKLPEGHLDEVSFGNMADELAEVADLFRTVGVLARLLPNKGELGLLKPLLVVLPRFQNALQSLDFLGVRIGHVIRDGAVYQGSGQILLRRRREL